MRELETGNPAPLSELERREWIAFSEIEPFGDEYWQTALICACILNANRTKGRALKPEDILPVLKQRKPSQTAAETIAAFRALGY